MKNQMKLLFSMFIVVLFIFQSLNAGVQDSQHVTEAWQKISENKFEEAKKDFQDAIAENENNPRPYWGLSFIQQLQRHDEEAWKYYEKAINKSTNSYPYIFAAVMTRRGLLISNAEKGRGLMKLMPQLAKKADPSGVLQAGALEWMGRYNEEYGSIEKSKEYFEKLHTLDEWKIIGPFENISASGFEKVFPPEKEYNPTAQYFGKSGVPATWFKIKKIRNDKWIDFTHYFSNKTSIFYGNSFVYSPEKQVVQIRV
ncbi:MAG: hypothetical protein KAR38_12595, partial [Calditrichia bacterium]|nr:hypothetical protein [Calditrichia bacterium]